MRFGLWGGGVAEPTRFRYHESARCRQRVMTGGDSDYQFIL